MSICEQPTRREFIAGAVCAGVGMMADAKPVSVRPNIIYINSHDSGRYLQPYGYDVPTPNIQKLASEGVLFRNTFSVAPTCSPSRAGLLTGQCPHKNGMLGLVNQGWMLNDYKKHLVHTLRAAGYVSYFAGVQHVAPKADMIGYDHIVSTKTAEYPTWNSFFAKDVGPAVAEFLATRPSGPFFLEVGFFETHRPYPTPSLADKSAYMAPPKPLPDVLPVRDDVACYHASARNLDKAVGLILEALSKADLSDNTLVINTTDHGIAFPGMKCSLTDSGTAVSLIMRGPHDFRSGSVCDAFLSQLDIFPTICDYLGIERPSWLEGRSFLPVLRGQASEIHEEVFSEVTYHAAYEPKRSVRTPRWKYIKRFDGRKTAVLPNCDPGLTKSFLLDHGWKENETESEEKLFDLIFDPNERNNLAGNPAHSKILHEMRGRLDAWMQRTEDPLLKGPVPLAPGAKTINPNDTVRDWDGFNPAQIYGAIDLKLLDKQ